MILLQNQGINYCISFKFLKAVLCFFSFKFLIFFWVQTKPCLRSLWLLLFGLLKGFRSSCEDIFRFSKIFPLSTMRSFLMPHMLGLLVRWYQSAPIKSRNERRPTWLKKREKIKTKCTREQRNISFKF